MKKAKNTDNTDLCIALIPVVFALAALLWFFWPETPHYTVGKCYTHYENSGEAWDEGEYRTYKVLDIGKKNYQVCYVYPREGCKYNYSTSWLFSNFERYFSQEIECSGDK